MLCIIDDIAAFKTSHTTLTFTRFTLVVFATTFLHVAENRGLRTSQCRSGVVRMTSSGTLLASSTVQYRPPILPSATLTVAVRHHVTDDHRRVVWDDKPTTVGVHPDPRARHSTMSPRRPGTQSSAASVCPALSVRSLAFVVRT